MSYNPTTNKYEGYIYKIYNDINDKIYIGQTITTVKERWHGHKSASISEKRGTSVLYRAMQKYGRDKFHIETVMFIVANDLEQLRELLNKAEADKIKQYQSLVSQHGYNIKLGGSDSKTHGRKVHKYDMDLNYICSYISTQEAGRQNNIDGATIWQVCKHYFYTAGGYVWAFDGEDPIQPPLRVQELRRVIQYNAFEEVINIFDNVNEACSYLSINLSELMRNLNGLNLTHKRTILRFEGDPFNKFPLPKNLYPITIYSLQGVPLKRFETIADAEHYIGATQGELSKAIRRGGSCCGYLAARYGERLIRKTYTNDKHIDMCDDNFKCLKTFGTQMDIARYFGLKDCHHQISNAIKNKRKYRGYFWKYADEFQINK